MRSPNAALVGLPGSRRRLVTPCLVLDLDALESNIATMASRCRAAGIALRPHAKTHKSVRIARLQVDAGAVGVCCATMGEAETMAQAGLPGILVTSPVVQAANVQRLVALRRGGADVAVVVDHAANIAALADAVGGAGVTLRVLVDFDVGTGRTGAASVDDAIALARLVAAAPGLSFGGVQAYAGHLQHIESFAARRELGEQQHARVRELVAALSREGLAPAVVTGGGTGTHELDLASRTFTELQAGSYTVMDVEYGDVELTDGASPSPLRNALFVRTTVVSANQRGFVTTDAGLKRFATDGPRPRIASGAPDGAVYGYAGDEHGCVVFADASQTMAIGAALECVVPHCDPTVNLYDEFCCVRGDTLVELWPVDARGR